MQRSQGPEENKAINVSASLESKKTTEYKLNKNANEYAAENAIIANPYQEYSKYLKRLQKEGENASFPEFKHTIEFLQAELSSEKIEIIIKTNSALAIQRDLAQKYLFQVGLDFIVDAKDYPYPAPFKPYPYRPTIEAIQQSLEFFDAVERLVKKDRVPPLYHTDRYYYHSWPLLADKSVVLFPTTRPLTMEDLIRVRSVPIGFLGVTTRTLFADRHLQSPLDFYIHDMNHTRRMVAYLHKYCRENNATTLDQQLKIYENFANFIKDTIIPNIEEIESMTSEEDHAIRCIVRTIIFEIFHETAFAPTKAAMLQTLHHIPGAPAPFEYMILHEDFKSEELEKIRTKTGNLESGSSLALSKNKTAGVKVRYFMDEGPNILANVFNKLVHGFYDPYYKPTAKVVPPKDRSAENIVKAAEKIFAILDEKPLAKDKLLAYVLSRDGIVRKFNYPKIQFNTPETKNDSAQMRNLADSKQTELFQQPTVTSYSLFEDKTAGITKIPSGTIAKWPADNNSFASLRPNSVYRP